MTDPQQTATQQSAASQPPRIPTGQELYDMLMNHIETELTTEGRKTLDAKYPSETPEERGTRKRRYEIAFERYQQAYEGYMDTLRSQVERYRRTSFDEVELEDRHNEQGILDQLSQALSLPAAA
ncbi:hypothetical protein HY285_02130 [Candidatus Peregrinibacteria bacterium]|nr:hypothetical protein [Candidatus Peregrinibacteria bacterium]MBI3816324.1 hypothetical protein [Candidatus Peregrinibacteria bacterium]